MRIGGHDIRTLDPEALHRMIAVVHQDTYLFHGTVEENLRLGKPDATHDELEAAARDANAHEFISLLAARLRDDDRRARRPACRAGNASVWPSPAPCCATAPILILDEALSSVDAENEAVIQQAIDRLSAGARP